MKWITFNQDKWDKQELPPEKKFVLIQVEGDEVGTAPSVAVGYLKYGGGCKDSPFFVVPGLIRTEIITHRLTEEKVLQTTGFVVHSWCDCLDVENFTAPLWNK